MKVLEYENRFGRRGGRGIRPWLLIPKVLAIAVYFGGLVAVAIILFGPRHVSYDEIVITRRIFLHAIIPALGIAAAMGVALLLQHPKQLLAMRWLRLKLLLIAVFVPAAHLFMSSKMRKIELSLDDLNRLDPAAVNQFRWGLLAVIAVSVLIIILGRLKPRLGKKITSSPSSLPSPTYPAA